MSLSLRLARTCCLWLVSMALGGCASVQSGDRVIERHDKVLSGPPPAECVKAR